MKKRLISMLLAVLMVTSLFGGMSVSAFADGDYKTTTYTMAQGDTVLQICNKLGLNYYSCKTAIEKLNNITSDAQYRKLSVGQVLTLPASDADAVKIAQANVGNGGSNGGSIIGGGNNGGNTGNGGNVSNANVAYWLIPYTMQKGETVTGVCNTLGINFSAYADQIKSLNKISAWNKVAAGKTLLLPSAVSPSAGISCYAVVAHYVSRGETAYGICQSYGIGYNANSALLQGLNPKVSLTNIKANTTLLVPVPTVITSGGGNNGGTVIPPSGGNNGGNNNNNNNNNNNGGNNGSTGKVYKLTTGTVSGGKVTFSVNGKTTTSAAAGSKVLINVSPESGKGLKSLSLVYADGSAVPTIKDGSFTMPECDVRVTAEFSGGYYMGPISAHGSVTLYNNTSNVITSTAAKGAEIKVVVTPATGYEISRIYIQRNDGSGKIVKDNMKSGDTFTMPDCPVFVRVDYAGQDRYSVTKKAVDWNGDFEIKAKGSQIESAATGTRVDIVSTPASGYVVDKVIVKTADGEVKVTDNSYFTMPAANVTVSVYFKVAGATTYSVTVAAGENGTASANVSEAKAGTKIALTAVPDAGYELYKYIVTANGVTKDVIGTNEVQMPAYDVTITPVFKPKSVPVVVEINNGANGTVKVTSDGTEVADGGVTKVGSTINVSVTPNDGYTASVKINGQDVDSYKVAGKDSAVTVEVTYTQKQYYTLLIGDANKGLFDLEINGTKKEITTDIKNLSLEAGDSIKVVLKADSIYTGAGASFDGTVAENMPSDLTMPSEDATITVSVW